MITPVLPAASILAATGTLETAEFAVKLLKRTSMTRIIQVSRFQAEEFDYYILIDPEV
jgi:hypothetical protein